MKGRRRERRKDGLCKLESISVGKVKLLVCPLTLRVFAVGNW